VKIERQHIFIADVEYEVPSGVAQELERLQSREAAARKILEPLSDCDPDDLGGM